MVLSFFSCFAPRPCNEQLQASAPPLGPAGDGPDSVSHSRRSSASRRSPAATLPAEELQLHINVKAELQTSESSKPRLDDPSPRHIGSLAAQAVLSPPTSTPSSPFCLQQAPQPEDDEAALPVHDREHLLAPAPTDSAAASGLSRDAVEPCGKPEDAPLTPSAASQDDQILFQDLGNKPSQPGTPRPSGNSRLAAASTRRVPSRLCSASDQDFRAQHAHPMSRGHGPHHGGSLSPGAQLLAKICNSALANSPADAGPVCFNFPAPRKATNHTTRTSPPPNCCELFRLHLECLQQYKELQAQGIIANVPSSETALVRKVQEMYKGSRPSA